ncbi:SDR family oxidoreductase [Oceanibaculum sp.]|uniref:SDR family oxidoreductase n=1 Tax=Oceanibaculum sp. TaxID=1903597 RepID=UPI00258DB695|nr:SDR family oxidoreductase [Oceanibaculum sp.]MCH2395246.1 SDR family oxidoreductase [Oceanibaculum sp.]
MRLKDKIAIVTGGGSGIGHATCLTFAREGAYVVVADRNAEAASKVAEELKQAGGKGEALAVNVADSKAVKAMVEDVVARHGRLDILVNNAGYGIAGTVVNTTEEDWDALMSVNVNGVFYGCKHAIPIMEKQGGGVIVNTASTVSKVGIPNRAAYCASKGAVASLTRAMALDHVDANIRVNCVAPGTIESPYFDEIFRKSNDAAALRDGLEKRQAMKRLGKPQEIANAILFLASEESSFCTGSMLLVDGGWTAK